MDPLSIIASIIAIGSFATASLNVILKIRGASDEVQALINEISDLSAIVKDVEHTLRYNNRLNAESNGVATLHAVLSKAHTTINHLHAFVSRVLMKEETLLRDARISRTTWLREKPQVSKYQRQLLAIKLELSHALGIANLSTSARIELSVANVVALSDSSRTLLQAQASDARGIRNEIQKLRQLVDSKSGWESSDPPLPYIPQPNILPLHSGNINKGTDVLLEGRRGLEVQVTWRPSWACDSASHCLCHESTHGRSPHLLDKFLGILFWGYCGLPIIRKRCDVASCRRRRGLRFGMSYYFPAWFVEKKLELTFRPMPLGTPQISIKMASIVSNGALIFKYTHNKDLAGIQSLFSQGLAAPSDAGHLDGCTALHFAVEHGSIEVINFLLKTDADRYALNTHHESPASYAWDIILGNSMDKEIIDFLRAAFSERDFLEEQNFNLAHEIVLGLNGRRLADAIEERPSLTDSPDTRGNTPLIWAATRGDTASLQELLKHGASVDFRNNNGWNALYTAVNHSRLDCTTTLLSYGYTDHKDGYGMTALHRACQQNDATFVQLLLEHDLNVDEQDVFQRCPLALAAWRNNALGVQYLLDSGADREKRDIFGATPLLRAIQYAAVDAARVLLENKCDVHAVDHESQTLLHRAALSRDIPTIKLLGEKGHTLRNVETNAKSVFGRTAMEQLQTVEPSAELLRAFTTMLTALQSARLSAQTAKRPPVENLNTDTDQDIFKDAIEFQSDASSSPASSYPSTDNESLLAVKRGRRSREKTRLTKSLDRLGRNWASKYRDTFRTFDRASNSATASTIRLGGAQTIPSKG